MDGQVQVRGMTQYCTMQQKRVGQDIPDVEKARGTKVELEDPAMLGGCPPQSHTSRDKPGSPLPSTRTRLDTVIIIASIHPS